MASTPVSSTSHPDLGRGETLRMRADIPAGFTELEIFARTLAEDGAALDPATLTVTIDGVPAERLASDRFRVPPASSRERTIEFALATTARAPVELQVSAINPAAKCRVCAV